MNTPLPPLPLAGEGRGEGLAAHTPPGSGQAPAALLVEGSARPALTPTLSRVREREPARPCPGERDTVRTQAVQFARHLRRQQTPAEARLWRGVRNRALAGAKVCRQVPCGPYTLDFAVREQRLAIEVDGDTHATGDGPARDARRTAYLAQQGWRVLRFTNRDVLGNLEGVLLVVAAALSTPHPDPLPQGEGAAAPSCAE